MAKRSGEGISVYPLALGGKPPKASPSEDAHPPKTNSARSEKLEPAAPDPFGLHRRTAYKHIPVVQERLLLAGRFQ